MGDFSTIIWIIAVNIEHSLKCWVCYLYNILLWKISIEITSLDHARNQHEKAITKHTQNIQLKQANIYVSVTIIVLLHGMTMT